jgi:hypothetical protein
MFGRCWVRAGWRGRADGGDHGDRSGSELASPLPVPEQADPERCSHGMDLTVVTTKRLDLRQRVPNEERA